MRRLLLISTILLLTPSLIRAQGGNTTVIATIKDPSNNLYSNSQVNISFFDPGTSHKLPLLNGSTFQVTYTGYSTNSSGVMPPISLADNGAIASGSGATGTQWSFNICFSDRVTCFSTKITINCAANIPATCTSNTIDISAALQAASAPVSVVTQPASLTGNNAFSGNNTFSGNNSFSGNNTNSGIETFTGAINCTIVNAVRCISPTNPQLWAGADLGAWLNAAQTSCAGSCIIQVASGTYTLSTATSIGNIAGTNKVAVQLSSGATITQSAVITLYADSSFVGPPSPSSTSTNTAPVTITQANTSNLAAMIQCGDGTNNGNGCTLGYLHLDGNKANNITAGPNVLINKSSRAHIFYVTSRVSNSDGFRVTSTLVGQESEAPKFENILTDTNNGHGLGCINTNDGGVTGFSEFENNIGNGLDLNNCSGWRIVNFDNSSNTEGVKCYGTIAGNRCSQNYIALMIANNNSQQDVDIQGWDSVGAAIANTGNQVVNFSLSGSARRTNQTFDGILIQDSLYNVVGPGYIATGQIGSGVKYCIESKKVSAGAPGLNIVNNITCQRGSTPLGDWSFQQNDMQANLNANNQLFAQYANMVIPGTAVDPAGTAGFFNYRTDLARMRYFDSSWHSIPGLDTTDTLTSKTLTSPALTTPTIGGGTALNLYKTVTDTPGAITVNTLTCTDRSVALAGSGTGAIIGIAANYALEPNLILSPGQAVAGTVHYRICNFTAANITINAAATFNLAVIQ